MSQLETRTMAKVSRHLMPFIILCFFVAYLDRVNLSFAALTMNQDLGFTASIYGFGAGVFFIGYFLFETPSNFVLVRVGARRWFARIMFTWGILSGAMAFVKSDTVFYALRFLLGAAEAGLAPGLLFFVTLFFPAAYRGRAMAWYMVAIPMSAVIGAPISTAILYADGLLGLHGWQWIFIIEAMPSLVLAFVVLWYMPDDPSDSRWLADDERDWLVQRQAAERKTREAVQKLSVWQVMIDARVLTLSVASFGIAYSIFGILYFMPQIVKSFGLNNMQTGIVSALPFFVGAVGMLWYGRHSDRMMERRTHTAFAFLITAVGLVIAALLSSPLPRLIALCFASFGAFSVLPVFWSIPAAFLSGAAAAVGMAYINSIGNVAGFAGPFIMGWIKDVTGSFDGGLLVTAAVSIVAAMATLCLSYDPQLEQRERDSSEVEPAGTIR
jgi:MFS transporter, ACS family, tartrate transporter